MREKITTAVFFVFLAIFFTIVMICPKDEEAAVIENRSLAKFPEVTMEKIFNGSFEGGYETYLTDNVGYRTKFVAAGNKIESLMGVVVEDESRIIARSSGNLVLDDGRIMEAFVSKPSVQNGYVEILNEYAKILGDETECYIMLAPTRIEFDHSKYKVMSDSQKEAINDIYLKLEGFNTVNVYDTLKENVDKDTYFNTDHHWTQRGAYLAYTEFAKAAGFEPKDINTLNNIKYDNFLGYLYNQANVPEYSKYADIMEIFEVEENYEVFAKSVDTSKSDEFDEEKVIEEYTTNIYSKPNEGEGARYTVFMGGDHSFSKINTKVENGRTALIVKDSYANTVIPFLTNHYETILIIDPRSFYSSIQQLKSDYRIDDLIVINYVFSTVFDDYVMKLEKIAGLTDHTKISWYYSGLQKKKYTQFKIKDK